MRPWNEELERAALRLATSESSTAASEDISLASVWEMASPEDADRALAGQSSQYVYRRDGHPNDRSLAGKLCELHGGQGATLTAQGMSALSAMAMTVLKPGAEVWLAQELYGKSVQLFTEALGTWGIRCVEFDPTCREDLDRLSAANADLVLVETLSNPRLMVPDLQQLAAASERAGAVSVVDNTFATPFLCRPLEHGIDVVVESLGKLVNGHSDAMLGLVVTREQELSNRLQQVVSTFGMASSPLDCYLTSRGLATLGVRIARSVDNALALSQKLEMLDEVVHVDYPGLPRHPQHELAGRQFSGGYGWMLAFTLDIDNAGIQRLFTALKPEVAFLPSLGDVSTSVSHPASTSHRKLSPVARRQLGITDGTVRVSCGLEPAEWLIQKFATAISELG